MSVPLRLSRATLYSLLLLLLTAGGLGIWFANLNDACTHVPEANVGSATELVLTGSRLVEVSCRNWIARMPPEMQLFALAACVIAVVFLVSAISDLHRWMQIRGS